MKNLKKSMADFAVTLRFSLLSIFSVLFITSMLLLMSIGYYRISTMMHYISIRLMNQISSNVSGKIAHEIQNVKTEVEYSANLLQSKVINPENLQSLIPFTYDLLTIKSKILPGVSSAAFADESGNFVQSQKNIDGSSTSTIIDRFHSPATLTTITRDANNHSIKKSSTNINYEPRQRFWYTNAKNKRAITESDVYQYELNGVKYWGTTITTPVFSPEGSVSGVFGVQMGIDFIRKIIEDLEYSKYGKVFIVKFDGSLIAFPDFSEFNKSALINIHDLPFPWIGKSFDLYKNNKESEFTFSYDNNKYIATYTVVSLIGTQKWLIGTVIPERYFIGELIKTNYIVIAVGFIILIIAVFLGSILLMRVVKPLRRLAKETEYIKDFDLSHDINIKSRIKEIMLLANEFTAMLQGLRSFKKYVPANLVRQIVTAGESANVGGANKNLTVLFSDIKDFTSIVEYEDPQVVTALLCEYFNIISNIIEGGKGTIDKFVGDSIMAFWGAPLVETDPMHKAAKAALHCVREIHKLNNEWQSKGILPFITRFGIHQGNAIIGNVGSSERFNYTAIGNTINTASRLEGANKIYGTTIIVSEAVYQHISDMFILRMIDLVSLKGQTETGYIYELLAEQSEQLDFDIERYNATFANGFNAYRQREWDKATEYFTLCLTIYPKDTVAKVFIERCKQFKLHPPKVNWNGAHHF